jgi:exosome complex component RRP4
MTKSEVVVQHKSVAIPGQVLAQGMDYLPGENTYREGDAIFSERLGLVGISGRVIKIMPLKGPYKPKVGDKIIAKVFDITMSGWRVETNTAYAAMLNVKDASSRFIRKGEDLSGIISIGEFVVVKIYNVTSQNLIDVTMKEPGLRKVEGGRIISINSMKVPRVIGKQGSMISLVKRYTDADITVGQNGLIWIRAKESAMEFLAEEAIKLVEDKSHLSGLTEKVETFLQEKTGKNISGQLRAPAISPKEIAPSQGGEE